MREIQLTGSGIALVDDEDFDELSKYGWHTCKNKNTWYAFRSVTVEPGWQKNIGMHRYITACPDGLYVDHIDHNGLNNQKSNLRICTRSENARNRNKNSGNKWKSAFKGVTFTSDKKWVATIHTKAKYGYLGSYNTEIEAANAYDDAAKELFGEFAKTNFM